MGNKTRYTANLVSDNNLFVDITNDRVGIGSTQPTADLDVNGQTKLDNLNVSGISTFNEDVQFIGNNTNMRWDHSTSDLILFDNTRLEFGSNKDFEIWHGGAHTNLKNNGGDLRIRGDKILLKRADDSERYLEANVNNEVKLFFNGNEKFATTNTGAVITGVCSATSFSGSGANLTNLPNTGIGTTGSVNTTGVITATSFVGDGSGLTGITASGSGVVIKDGGTLVGTAGTINFGNNISVSTISSGIVTVTAAAGTIIGINTSGLTELNNLTVSGISTFTGAIDANGDLDVDGHTELDNLNVSGISTFQDNVHIDDSDSIYFGADNDLRIVHLADGGGFNFIDGASQLYLRSSDRITLRTFDSNEYLADFIANGAVELYYDNSKKFETTGSGAIVTGVVTATSFTGNGNDIVHSTWTLGANGSSHYTFTGPGGLSATDDPKIYLARGQTYEFVNNSGGSHPFQIQQSNGSTYSTGVTNNGASSGTIRFEVPFSAPNTLQYKCTNHSSMGNTIIVYPDISP